MNEEFECGGEWWLPDNPEEKIRGTLKFAHGEGGILDLDGNFGDIEGINEFLEVPIILGSSRGENITLHRCSRQKSSLHIPRHSTSQFFVSKIFKGVHFQMPEEIKFKSIAIHYSHLDEWVNISGLRHFSHDDGEIKYELPDPIEARINDDYTIKIIGVEFPWSRVTKEISIKEKTCIKIEAAEEKSFEELMEMSHRIQQFLSLAMGEPVHPLDIKGVTETEDERRAERIYNPPVDIFSRIPFFNPVTRPLHPKDILFTFREISDRFGNMLRNWIEKSELFEPVYDLHFGTIYDPDLYLELEFLSLMQAIETFHRRKYGGKYLADEKYLFSWNNVPGNESHSLIKFLVDERGIEWAKNAEIKKVNEKIIRILNGKNSAELRVAKEEDEVKIEVAGEKTPYYLKIKKEGDKLKIYHEEYAKVRYALENAIPDYLKDDHKRSLKSRIKYDNEFSLRTRLKKIFKEYQENLKVFIHDEKRFIDKVVNTRNYLTHYEPKSKRKIVITELEELDLLTQKLRRIVEICLLRELDFEPEEVEKIFFEVQEVSD